jgi:sterol desaturase/sphingolipid hydroxylase (fatty acid hydroxylase superfamily)
MESIVNYFETIPSLHRSLLLVGGITFFWIVENAAPLYHFKYNKWQHAGINIFFTITTILINFLLAFIFVKASDWTQTEQFGILNWLPKMPLWLEMIVGLLLLDLIGAYFVHWTEHRVKWMWRFHLIHHTDTHLDTTSANRHHPGESVFRFLFTTLAVVIAGAPMWLVFMYQFFSILLSQFNHANIALPKWLDNALGHIIITPDIHHVHHHYMLPYTDSNFGNIFSIWDRLFGTYRMIDKDKLIYGIDTYMDPNENARLNPLIKIPFQEYRKPVGAKFENAP